MRFDPAASPRRVVIETLEARELLSAVTLRMVSYNIAADVNGYTTPRPGLYDVLQAIGAHSIGGTAQPIDVLALQETTTNSTTVQPIVDALNTYYGAGTYAMSPVQGLEYNNNPSIGNGPNALVYNTKTLTLLESYGLPGPFGSTSGMYRQVMRYKFEAVGGSAISDFYIYDVHSKSGSTTTDLASRDAEAKLIRSDEATLPATARVLYAGDFNLRTSSEASYTTLTAAGQGQAFDPINTPGNWYNNSAYVGIMSDSSTSLRYRTDFIFATSNVMTDPSGLSYIGGHYESFGNNGSVAVGGSVSSVTNTSLADLANRSTILSDLTTASDHLPIVADFLDPLTSTPTIGGFAVTPTSVVAGSSATLTAGNVTDIGSTISAVNFYRETNGITGLQADDTALGVGSASGTTWSLSTSTTGFSAGTYTYYAVASDAAGQSTAPSAATLSVTIPTPVSGTVLGWDVNGQTNWGAQGLKPGTVAASNTNSLGLTRGNGVSTSGTAASNAWGGSNWASTSSAGISGNKFVSFGLTVAGGYSQSLSAVDLYYRRSSSGPTSGYWQYQINGGAWSLIGNFSNQFSSTSTSGANMTELNLSGITGLQNLSAGTSVNLRLTPFGATSTSGTWYVYNHSGNDLYVKGTYTPVASSTMTASATSSLFSTVSITDDVKKHKRLF